MAYTSVLVELESLVDSRQTRATESGIGDFSGEHGTLIEKIGRLARIIALDRYRSLLLILKAMWEDHANRRRGKSSGEQGNGIRLFLSGETPSSFDDDDFSTFKPDIETIVSLSPLPQNERPELLVQEMLLNRMYVQRLDSDTVRAFIEKKEDERMLLGEADQAVQKEFWFAKCVWIELNENIAELLLVHESARLHNAYVMREFFRLFGDAFVRMREQLFRMLDLERRIMLKENNPAWSVPDIDRRVAEIESGEADELAKIRDDSKTAGALDEIRPGAAIDDGALREYRTNVKKRLREIFLLLHPHRLAHNPSYASLTPEQRAHLADLWDRVMEIRQIELKYPEGTLGRSFHSLEKLDDVLDTARRIMDHSGLELNVDYIIRGGTIAERTSWLNAEIVQLEEEIGMLRDELLALETDADVAEKRAVVEAVDRHDEVCRRMIEKAAALGCEADALELRYRALFPGARNPDGHHG